MKYTRVRRAVSAVVIDSWDEDRNPEHIKVNGNVTFRPLLNDGDVVQWAGPNGPESLVLAPIQCRISDGIIMHRGGEGVYLAAGGEGCEPDLIQWKAEFSSMQAGGWSFKLKPVMFDAVPDGEVDLTMVAPVAGASEPIVRGPAGTGIDNIKVDGAELVITARSEAGVFEMARIPLEDVVKAEADAAAKSAADNVRSEFTTAATSAKDSATAAAESAKAATAKAGEASTQATNAKTSATAAKTSETNAASSASSAATSAAKAEGSATTAATSAQTATSKAGEATTQAVNAANNAGAAKTSETNALSSANAAKSSESSAKTSGTNAASSANAAKSSATAASSSASKAATSERNAADSASAAAESASQAAGSAASAKQDADRAGSIADSTSWDGDKLTVNGKTSPSLRGPKGDPGQDGKMTFEDLTPAQRDSLKGDRGEPGPPGKPGPSGASTWEDVQNKPASFPPASHTHRRADITDLPSLAEGNIEGSIPVRGSTGHFYVRYPEQDGHPATKSYVDETAYPRKVKLIKGAVDLDDYKKTGAYHQSLDRDARAGTNYPNGRAGLLEVFNPEADMAYQRYTDYGFQNNVWTRGLYSGKWSSWVKVSQDGHKHTMSDITDLPPVSKGASAHSIAQRNSDGTLYVSEPASSSHAANRSYVDTALGTAKAYTDALIVVGDTHAKDGKLHIVYE